MAELSVCRLDELPPGAMKLVHAGEIAVGVYNIDGEFYALEDRCSHDDGPLVEGEWEPDEAVVVCPRHGARFDIRTGRALSLPAYLPVDTFPVRVDDGVVKVDVT
ncbi:MAG: non-heme iron oxygenase ferredoxin subunit [Actinomycetota bacterium]|nr:non-heme iron oxygenase ferredoxin subunit [Actinomycetota bacterium]